MARVYILLFLLLFGIGVSAQSVVFIDSKQGTVAPENALNALPNNNFSVLCELNKSWFKKDSLQTNLEVGILNDSWGGGFTKIEDDYRSFGLVAKYTHSNNVSLLTTLSALTTKSWSGLYQKARLDEGLILGKFLLAQNKQSKF